MIRRTLPRTGKLRRRPSCSEQTCIRPGPALGVFGTDRISSSGHTRPFRGAFLPTFFITVACPPSTRFEAKSTNNVNVHKHLSNPIIARIFVRYKSFLLDMN
uniref:(northern house mosquito) hypothetical protein n=1 Tax=Culex pipiens TaxID=7175 RepID=A0A8D8JZR9_CULPI